ncbi:MAG: polA, partial [Firmicutes bacterium]|nr:polA [Bacillota bacterium]
ISGKKLQENLRNNKEIALLSKQLATIKCDMSIDFAKYDFGIHPNLEKMKELFAKFEFKSLLARVHSIFPGHEQEQEVEAEALPPIDEITDAAEVASLITQIRKTGILEFYPIITGDLPAVHIGGISFILEGKIKYISSETAGWQEFLTLFPDATIMKVTHDAKKKYLGKCSTIQWQKMYYEPLFAVWAIEVIHDIYPILKQGLIDNELIHLFNEIELPLVEVLSIVENHGIKVDREYLQIMSVEIGAKIELLLTKIYQCAGETFNVNSPKQLGVILFEKLNLPVMKKTKTGYSTDAEVLEKLAGQHAIVDTILEYRMLAKLKSTYLDGMVDLISPATGRIHTTFNQMVTATGRLSSSEPNLQNIPIRTEIGKKIRELFIPGAGYDYLMSADYSQIELRVLADMSGDANLIESFAKEQDVHTRTAAEVFEVPMEEVTSELRSRAKAVNFGIVYGISDYGLSRDTGVSRKEASQYIENYFTKYNGVKAFMDKAVGAAHQQGYVTTLLGRRRYLPDINSKNFNQRSFAERTAMNTPIQGTAADIIKKAMVDVYRALQKEKLQSRILLQVHDELVLEVPIGEVEQVSKIVKEAMEQSVTLKVPLVVDVKIGKNWADAK